MVSGCITLAHAWSAEGQQKFRHERSAIPFVSAPVGMQAMLKDGHQMFSGLDEAVLKNIDACKQLSLLTKTSMGPNGETPPPCRPQ